MRLLDELKNFLHAEALLAKDRSGEPADIEVQAATALLLLEVAHGDEVYEWREHRAIVHGLERAFGLDRKHVLRLLRRSEEIRPPAVKLADVTEVIRERYDDVQRLEVVRLLWEVVNADGFVEDWERSFATHVAQALGIDNDTVLAARAGTAADD